MGCEHSVPVATADDFQYVHSKPPALFHDGVSPGNKPGELYRLKMKRKIWSFTGSSAITYDDGRPFPLKVQGTAWSMRKKTILRDTEGRDVGVMMKMFCRREKTFKVYGFKPLYPAQAPSNQSHEGRRLFTWAEVTDKAYSLRYVMSSGRDTYVADREGPAFGLKQYKLSRNGKVCATVQRDSHWMSCYWDIEIGPGVDPCLILAFAAVVDEINEERRRKKRRKKMSGL